MLELDCSRLGAMSKSENVYALQLNNTVRSVQNISLQTRVEGLVLRLRHAK